MTVYVEWVILDNMTFDCLVLFAVCKTMRLNARWWHIALGGAVGTACAFLTAFLPPLFTWLVKIACLPLMSLCCTRKRLPLFALLTCGYTFLLGGVIVGLFFLTKTDFSASCGTFSYDLNVPFSLYVVGVLVFSWLIFVIVTYARRSHKTAPFYRTVMLSLAPKRKLVGYVDSGNTLVCDGLPVCFISPDCDVAKQVQKAVSCGNGSQIALKTAVSTASVCATKCLLSCGGKTTEIFVAVGQNVTHCQILLNAFCEVDCENFEITAKTC